MTRPRVAARVGLLKRRGWPLLLYAGPFSLACGQALSENGTARQAVVYGADKRIEVRDCPDARVADLAQNTSVALVKKGALSMGANGVQLETETWGEQPELCSEGLRFSGQPMLAFCSGVLVAEDKVLTAGHCIRDASACADTWVVFGYELDAFKGVNLEAAQIFSCSEILAQEESPFGSLIWYDSALIRLERRVPATRRPARVRFDPPVAGERVAVVSNGFGLPTKIDLDGYVTNPRAEIGDYFEAHLDNFEGGSGGAVFDQVGELLGIAVRGQQDLTYDANRSCVTIAELSDETQLGEQVSYAELALSRSLPGQVVLARRAAEEAALGGIPIEAHCALAVQQPRGVSAGPWLPVFGLGAFVLLRRRARGRRALGSWGGSGFGVERVCVLPRGAVRTVAD
jgi:hypothetical protein